MAGKTGDADVGRGVGVMLSVRWGGWGVEGWVGRERG